MAGIDAIYEYLAVLIGEQDADKRFLVNQVMPAVQYKFPDFTFAQFRLETLKDFILSGEKAGYFKLVNTGSMQTAYLLPGKRTAAPSDPETLRGDPIRPTRPLSHVAEEMLNADRADQIIEALRGVNIKDPTFDAYLAQAEQTAATYPMRGKLRRLRRFVALYREKGETQAGVSWQSSRTVIRIPSVPPIEEAIRAHGLITALMQDNISLQEIYPESLTDMFYAVLIFARQRLTRDRAWDWVAGLEILDADARTMPRLIPKRGLFGKPTPTVGVDDEAIARLVVQLNSETDRWTSQSDDTTLWKAFVATSDQTAALHYLEQHAALYQDDRLLTWLEDVLSQSVEAGDAEVIRRLATRSAILLGARQMGLEKLRQQPGEVSRLYDTIMDGTHLLEQLFAYLNAQDDLTAQRYLVAHPDLFREDSVGALMDTQLIKVARSGDTTRYRRVSNRLDLWRKVIALGMDEGIRQHERYLETERTEKTLQAEMGILLLVTARTSDSRRDILERYPAVATPEALSMADGMLEMLSFQRADADDYNRQFEVKRLIERCLHIGLDRALAEMK